MQDLVITTEPPELPGQRVVPYNLQALGSFRAIREMNKYWYLEDQQKSYHTYLLMVLSQNYYTIK